MISQIGSLKEYVPIDLMYLHNADYLVKYFSKWIEAVKTDNKTRVVIILKLEIIFERFGISETIICDNMPFNSYYFKRFRNYIY